MKQISDKCSKLRLNRTTYRPSVHTWIKIIRYYITAVLYLYKQSHSTYIWMYIKVLGKATVEKVFDPIVLFIYHYFSFCKNHKNSSDIKTNNVMLRFLLMRKLSVPFFNCELQYSKLDFDNIS